MSLNLILLKLVVFVGFSGTLAAVINKDNEYAEANTSDLQVSATSAKLINLGSLLGLGNTGYYPNNNRPGYYPNYNYNTNGGFYPSVGKYPTTNVAGYYPDYNYYPTTGTNTPNYNYYPTTGTNVPNYNYYPTTGTNTPIGTNILGGGYGGYGGYGGNGGLRQYYGYWDPSYTGQRNLGYAYYTNTDKYGLPKATNANYGSREGDRVSYTFRGYN